MTSRGGTSASKCSDELTATISRGTQRQGRGAIRDREEGEETSRGFLENQEKIYITKPDHVSAKTGTSGSEVLLKANFFQIEELTDFDFHQYRVDFTPDLDMSNVRKAFIGRNISPFGGNCILEKNWSRIVKYLNSRLFV